MKALAKKTPEEIADELIAEDREVGGNFAERITSKLARYGYDPADRGLYQLVLSAFFDRR